MNKKDVRSVSRNDHNKQVAHYWSSVADREELGFWNLPGWETHQNQLASGNEDISWLDVLHKELQASGVSPGHALSLGCGSGQLERKMVSMGLCKTIDGCDISEPLLSMARTAAEKYNDSIKYFCADLNEPNFPHNRYDLIIGAGVFHHVENLEALFNNLKAALKPGGRLLMYDYVGPTRFQWTEQQTHICNKWLKKLPKRFKRKQGYPFHYVAAKKIFDLIPGAYSSWLQRCIKQWAPERIYAQFLRLRTAQIQMEELLPPPPEQFLVTDPSEAVRSSEILPILKTHFTIEKIIPQGGTIVQPLFGRTVGNFIKDPEGADWAKQVLEDERKAIQQGTLPSDFLALISVKH